ncbi:hypothetical protein SS50377_23507 [Spironucleus salmonicida]|uniref:Uncharacterized protein n=1 Tax=Spironucleus salmonicida TaxID=348837 RepID=V6LNS0_9EUKA|nr:hypothetical protein SS50377_23507 [Spironucleus salmonicida]|eukprot:EST46245.1 Hypothetical protein SS50377_13841 [Spironucleus salmonicida]
MHTSSQSKRSASQLRSNSIGRQLQSKILTYTQNNTQQRRNDLEQQIKNLKSKYQGESLIESQTLVQDDGLSLDYLQQQKQCIDNVQLGIDISQIGEVQQSPNPHQTLTQDQLSVFQNHSVMPQQQGQTQHDILISAGQEDIFSCLKSQMNQLQSQLDQQNTRSQESQNENQMQKRIIESLKLEIAQLRAQKRCIQDNYSTVMRQRHDEQQQVARLLQGTMADADLVTIQRIMFNGDTEPQNHAKNSAIQLSAIDASAQLLTQVELSNKVKELESIIQQQNELIQQKNQEMDQMKKHISAAVQALNVK